jgi:regulator of sigma E protease
MEGMSLGLLILGLVLFVLLVVVHELGHFLVARRNGVEVEEFGLGFPPRAKVLGRKNGTLYTLNWLPLGGFVRLKGEHDADTAPHSYGAASLKTKVKILLAGVGMNLLAAFVLLTVLALIGMPKLITKDVFGQDQYKVASDTKVIKNEVLIGYVEPGSPAEKVGLKVQDRLLGIQSGVPCPANADCTAASIENVTSSSTLPNLTKKFAGGPVRIEYERSGQTHWVDVTLRSAKEVNASLKTDSPKGYLGISPTDYTLTRSTWSAPIVAGGLIGQFTALTFKGLGVAVSSLAQGNTSKASQQVSGPVGIFVLLKDGSLLGYQFILIIIAVISLTLAIMNVLPIPALDGGKLFVTVVFRGLRLKLTEKIENWLYGAGFALLMLLIALITIVDVHRFF